jgi:prepilin-type N-terminal cleavage/methylation domain-containing protein
MRSAAPRGFTLLELMITVALTAILVSLGVQTFTVMMRGQRPRRMITQMQGAGRTGVTLIEAALRSASLGTGTGVIWTDKGGAGVRRPAVQIYENVAETAGFLDVKPGTDALLVVRAAAGPGAALSAETRETNVGFTVTNTSPPGGTAFAAGQRVLLGEYGDAVWIPVTAVDAGTKTVSSGLSVALYPGERASKASSGSLVRVARAQLFFVNGKDELVRAELAVPYLPPDASQITEYYEVARGVDNLQVDCAVDLGPAAGPCPAPLAVGADVTDEATASLGTFGAGGGARLDLNSIPTLRTVTLSIISRTAPLPSDTAQADAPIEIEGVALDASDAPLGSRFLRRSYRIGVAVRNTSLESL